MDYTLETSNFNSNRAGGSGAAFELHRPALVIGSEVGTSALDKS